MSSQVSCITFNNVFCNDLLFCIAQYLGDKDACRLFNTSKTTNTLVKKLKRYQIKSVITDKMYIPSHFQIIEMRTESKFANIPSSLSRLIMCGSFDEPLSLPSRLKYLELHGNFNLVATQMPNTMRTINVNDLIGDVEFPVGVENVQINNCPGINTDKLPSTVKYLKISGNFNRFIDYLPDKLLHLTLSNNFNQTVPFLPAGLKHLVFGYNFNQPVDELPLNLTHLLFGRCFNQSLEKLSTSHITYLTLGDDFDHPLPEFPKLMVLYISRYYSHSLNHLPKSTKIFFV